MDDNPKTRLAALDFLRGLDMMLLVVLAPLVHAANRAWGLPKGVLYQFSHPWGGFTLYDIIMPLFIFMCGAAVPYAMSRRLTAEGRPTAAFWRHLAARVALLWFLGTVVQGNFFAFDPMKFNPYSNTLQAIAAGYLVTSLALLVKARWFRPALIAACFVTYGAAMHFGGDYSVSGNVAHRIDQTIFSWMVPAGGHPLVGPWTQYTWWFSSLMFAAVALTGAQATEILRGTWSAKRKCALLAAIGGGALLVGWGLYFAGVPMIKPIMTVSFTLQAIGWCTLALTALYLLVDVWGVVPRFRLVMLFGQFALAAYLLGNLFRGVINRAADVFAHGLPNLFGKTAQPFAHEVVAVVILVLALAAWKRLKRQKAREK